MTRALSVLLMSFDVRRRHSSLLGETCHGIILHAFSNSNAYFWIILHPSKQAIADRPYSTTKQLDQIFFDLLFCLYVCLLQGCVLLWETCQGIILHAFSNSNAYFWIILHPSKQAIADRPYSTTIQQDQRFFEFHKVKKI